MRFISKILITLIALTHLYIAWFEIFAWQKYGPEIFPSFSPELIAQSTEMATNQGIYNAFLAVGLLWSLFIKDQKWHKNVATCFLIFVTVAGIVGAITVAPKILMIQTIPSSIALVLLHLGYLRSKQ